MKVYFANLNPCNARKINVKQYMDFVEKCKHQLVSDPKNADIIFVWGCEFRSDWRDFSFSVTQELSQKYTAKTVYIGCTFDDNSASKIKTELGIDVIPWKDEKNLFEEVVTESSLTLKDIPIKLAENRLVKNAAEHRKSHPLDNISFEDEYVKLSICEGCTRNCSFCSEKQMFPAYRSFPEADLLDQCERACQESGTKKIMLLGDNTGDYGIDTGSSLPQLIRKLKERLGSDIMVGISQLNPEYFIKFYGEMIALIENRNIVYLNIPIQSASDKLLLSMRRRYSFSQIDKLFSDFKTIGFKDFSTHLLFGFPGEDDDDVDKTLSFIVSHSPAHVVASAFMPHPSIGASSFSDQVSPEEVQLRLKRCEEELVKNGIKVATDWNTVTNRIMNRITSSLNIQSHDLERP